MTTLILVRHAKSDWGDPRLSDHDRPLNGRGMRDAPVMAERVAQAGSEVRTILSSTALRARTTAEFFGARLGLEPVLDADLYGAPAGRLLSVAAARGGGSVMVVAHDPGMSDLAFTLSGERIEHMPTCAVATFEWEEPDAAVAFAIDPDRWTFDAPRG